MFKVINNQTQILGLYLAVYVYFNHKFVYVSIKIIMFLKYLSLDIIYIFRNNYFQNKITIWRPWATVAQSSVKLFRYVTEADSLIALFELKAL